MTSPIAHTPATLVAKSRSVSIWPRWLVFNPILSSARPSVLGLRPIDTSTQSAVIVSASPPFAGSTVTVAFLPLTATPVTLVPSLNSTPCFLKILFASRSEERRVGQECVSTCRSRWSPYHSKKNTTTTHNTSRQHPPNSFNQHSTFIKITA